MPKNVERVKPKHFGEDKGVIIETICIDGFHDISDILENSGLKDDVFWDAFYGLIRDGELEADKKGFFYVSEKLRKDWEKLQDMN